MLKIPYFFLLHLRTEYPPMRLVAGQHAALSRYLTFPVTILTERHNNPRSYHSHIHPSSSHRYSVMDNWYCTWNPEKRHHLSIICQSLTVQQNMRTKYWPSGSLIMINRDILSWTWQILMTLQYCFCSCSPPVSPSHHIFMRTSDKVNCCHRSANYAQSQHGIFGEIVQL